VRVEELDTPCLVVDLDQTERNLQDMAEASRRSGVGLRPHAKTHKSPILARRQMELGAIGLTLAKIGEVEVFADAGLADVDTLIAFPIVGEPKVKRLLDLAERARVTVSLDNLEVARPIGAAARERGMEIPVLLEVETGFERVGAPPDELLELAKRVAGTPGIRMRGVMTFEGMSYTGTDDSARRPVVEEAGGMLVAVAERLRAAGLPIEVVSIGNTPSAKLAMAVKGVTEVRPGTYVFYDANHVRLRVCREDEVSATIHVRVVSHAAPDRAVVDGGSKSYTLDGAVLGARGLGLVKGMPGWRIDRATEEHGMLVKEDPHAPDLRIGQRLEIIPNHICPVVNLYDTIVIARGGEVVDRWPVAARGRIQ
jgi:D-serine deaminase-like pyridoxal phosphate-dependent protein